MRSRVRLGVAAATALQLFIDVAPSASAQRLSQRKSFEPPPVQSPFRRNARGRVTTGPSLQSPLTPPATLAGPDDVLMQEGLTQQHGGDLKAARKSYFELIKNFPTSRHIPSVYLAFGDYYFDQGQMPHAVRFYERVVRFPKYANADYALVKLAWAHMKLQKYQKALALFHRAIKMRPTKAVAQASEEGLVVAYSHAGKPRAAFMFFERTNKQRAAVLLEQLAWRYSAQGKLQAAQRVLGELMRRNPRAREQCTWQVAAVESAVFQGKTQDTQKALLDLIAVATSARARGLAGAARCGDRARSITLWQATAWQRDAHRTRGQRRLLDSAIAVYRAYDAAFPRSRDARRVRYYLAEALWRRAAVESSPRSAERLWRQASAAFRVVRVDRKQPADVVRASAKAANLADQNAGCVTRPSCKR